MNFSERERLENIRRNQELLKDLDLFNGRPKQNVQRRPSRPDKNKKNIKQRSQPERVQPRRTSNRLAGLEADSDTLKRKYEQEAEAARQKYEAEKRARHEEHDLTFLLGEDGEDTSKDELVQLLKGAMKEDRNRAASDSKEKHKDLKDVFDQMVLQSAEKVGQRRIYSMVFHPNADRDLVFTGDKEGSIGVWEPMARKETEDGLNSGRSWSLQVHGKSPVTCLRFDPVTADSLFSSSYDSTIRMQDLQRGTSTEVWSGQEDVLLSIFDILAPQTHASAFTQTPNPGLDERSVWIADHRGGLCHYDLRQSGRRHGETSRWQVCEKKVRSSRGKLKRFAEVSVRLEGCPLIQAYRHVSLLLLWINTFGCSMFENYRHCQLLMKLHTTQEMLKRKRYA